MSRASVDQPAVPPRAEGTTASLVEEGVVRQREACHARAKELGFEVAEECVDWEIARDRSRSRLKRLVCRLAAQADVAAVFVSEPSVLGSPSSLRRLRQRIEDAGARLVVVDDRAGSQSTTLQGRNERKRHEESRRVSESFDSQAGRQGL